MAQLAQTDSEHIPADPTQVVWDYAFKGSLAAGVTAEQEDEAFNEFGPTEEYEVEAILKRRGSGATREYLIKWLGYDGAMDETSWEKLANVVNAKEMIEAFDEKTDREAKRQKQADGGAGRDSGGGDDGDSSDSDHDDDYVDQEVKHAQWFKDVTMICKEKVPRV